MRSEMTNNLVSALKADTRIQDYKVNVSKKESFELFFVKGKLETMRCTDTCDRQATVYVDHDGFRGDAQFFVYPSTTAADLEALIAEAAANAGLIQNPPYSLPAGETGDYQVPGNLGDIPMTELAEQISQTVFGANTQQGGSLNAVEVFIDHHVDSVCNSRGLQKTQQRWTAMVEAIPTFNGDRESVELYEQYNFSSLDLSALTREISEKMADVKARYEAVKPDFSLDCPIVLNKLELNDLFTAVADDLNYATVYSHSNLMNRGDRLQKQILGDPITLRMAGSAQGSVASTCFDGDGLSLGSALLVKDGLVEGYYGSNRFGQYLGLTPTGNLSCLCVDPGTADETALAGQDYLEVVSMSGLQVDFFNDYIGGEIRLAYCHRGGQVLPVTGISISGSLEAVLSSIRLYRETSVFDGYVGPAKAILDHMKIF